MFRPFRLAWLLAALLMLPAAPRAGESPDVRLGRDVMPLFQSIRLHLDADKRSYSGSVHVDLDVKRAVSELQLHSEGQKLVRVTLLQGTDTLAVERRGGDHGLLTLTTARALRPGRATLEIDFTHMFGTRAVGLYRVVKDGRGYLFTQFESDDAREAFPCWDEPGFKFPYQVTLEIPAAHSAVSNTPVESETEKDGWKTIRFKKTAPLPSYLLEIATGPFEYTPVPGTSIPTRIVTVQGQRGLTGTAVEQTPRLLAALERWFGIPYPYEKLDLIAVPDFAYGAMENAGAITYREDALLVDPATATVGQRRSVAGTNCHELSHQWFGDLVTMCWWDDLWLNESFANWMAAKITDEVYPEFKDGLSNLERIERVKSGDMRPSTHAIRDSATSASAGLVNVGLVYSKGNAVLSMFESYLGPETFRKGVQAYLKAHAFGNATAADLWKALDAASGTNVSAAMATFTDQPGVPSLRVVPVEGGLRLTQSRCSPFGVSQPALRWNIPIAIRWSDGTTERTQRVLLTAESQVVKLTGATKIAWAMPNAGGHGYYAWSVPADMMETLATTAARRMTPWERVAFLGDLDMLLDSGELHGDTYLRSIAPFGDDPEPQVIASTMSALGVVRAPFVPDSAAAPFALYVRRTLGPALARIGYERKPGEDEVLGTMRGDLLSWLARRGDDDKVSAFAQTAAKRYLADSSSVDPGVVDAVLNLAARRGDAALFDELQHRFETATVPAMRRRYLAALGAFDDPRLEGRALEYMLDDHVRSSESMTVMAGFAGKNEAAGQRLFRWMLDHYDAIAARVPPPALRFMPLMGSGCSEERLQATRTFFGDPKHDIPGIDQTLARVSDNVHGCLSLREREGRAVTEYLKSLGAK